MRLGALDGLRGLAAVGVVVLHVWMFVQGDGGRPERTAADVLISQLRLGVPLFFVLSGFLIFRPFAAAALDRRPGPALVPYAMRRIARIVPAYWIAILGAAALLAWVEHPRAISVGQLPSFLLFLQNYDAATLGRVNPPSWTVAVEVSFYVVVPLIGLAAARAVRALPSRARRRVLALVCLAMVVAGAALFSVAKLNEWPKTMVYTLPVQLSAFAAGMLVAVLVHDRRTGVRATLPLAAVGVLLVLADGWWHGQTAGPLILRQLGNDLPATTGFSLLVAAIALGPLPGSQVLARGPLEYLGRISFGLYLWHFPMIYLLRASDRFPTTLLAAICLTLALSLTLAMLSWHLVERPVLERTRGIIARRRRARARVPAVAGD
ncbi:putative acyltransferase [Patulibacter medicamentivorans]|uniref:Putative acyltransferase n=1 Tax=Patulibacter medicamentivorans TaxID=1097667 RepID=H0EA38_9ACTN|nr:acyltransferase [Patulibacter medicamentivorans]EHN09476.1 putative acyltransferase [Patulibacter medicamentivorans]